MFLSHMFYFQKAFTNVRNHNLHNWLKNPVNYNSRFQTASKNVSGNKYKVTLLIHEFKIAHINHWWLRLTYTIPNWLWKPTILQYIFNLANKWFYFKRKHSQYSWYSWLIQHILKTMLQFQDTGTLANLNC